MPLPFFHRLEEDSAPRMIRGLSQPRTRTFALGLVLLAVAAISLANVSLRLIYSDIPYGKPLVLEPLPPPALWEDEWPLPLNRPLCLPKIYVYPDDPRMGEFPMKNIRMATAYSSESILLEQLRDANSIFHKTYVTTYPDEADFFLIPFQGATYLTHCWYKLARKDDCEVERLYMTPMMDHIQNNLPYWKRSNGRDHIMIHPMDLVTQYYPTNRERLLNATFLVTIGDKRYGAYASQRTRRYKDITIPSATLILNSANIRPAQYLNTDGLPLDGRRDIFAIFGGIYDNVNRTDRYSSGVRALLHEGIDRLPGYRIHPEWGYEEYGRLLSRAKYGLTPQGWTLDTTRVWEYIAFGVVPVVIADGIIEPFQDDIDWDSFIVRIRRSEAHRLDEILRAIPIEEYERKRRAVWHHGRQVLFSHDAWHLIVRQLCRMREDLAGMQTLAGGVHGRIDHDRTIIKTSLFP